MNECEPFDGCWPIFAFDEWTRFSRPTPFGFPEKSAEYFLCSRKKHLESARPLGGKEIDLQSHGQG